MKRFDKGYIYYSFLMDFFSTLLILFVFFSDFLFDDEIVAEKKIATLPFFAIAFIIIYLFFIAYRVLYRRASGYELTENEIKCNRGVLFKKKSVLEYKKVHAINKKQNIFHRIFGIALLTVDSGSTNTSHQAEIIIIEKATTVDALLSELKALKESGVRASDDSKKEEEVLLSDNDTLYNFTSKKKMIYTFINIISTAIFTAALGILAIIVLSICKITLQLDALGTWGQYFLYAVLITLGAIVLLGAISFIGCMIQSFVAYHKFTITRQDNDIQISYGLLERHTNTFSYDRIKAVKISQGPIQRILGFASIRLEVIGYTNSAGNDNNVELGVLVPFCKYDEINEILGKVLPDYVPDEKQTKAVSYFPFISWFTLLVGITTGIVLLLAIPPMLILNVPSSSIAIVAFAIAGSGVIIFVMKAISAVLSYKNNGLAINNSKITAYYGGFVRNITVFMRKNLVASENITTPLRRKAGITSIVMHIKTNAQSNEVKVHIQEDNLAEKLDNLLTF